MFKVEYFVEGLLIPIIAYEFFDPITNEQLDLNYCKDTKINFYVSVSIDEEQLFLYNPNSDYYNDICYPYSTENETDITLVDRKTEYNNKNLSLCEKNCQYIEYDLNSKKVLCQCMGQNKSPMKLDDIINTNKLLNNFIDIKSISNLDIIFCYNLIFSKDGILYNLGSYILLSIIFFYLISSIIFYFKGQVFEINISSTQFPSCIRSPFL